jgi:hypothetical protein
MREPSIRTTQRWEMTQMSTKGGHMARTIRVVLCTAVVGLGALVAPGAAGAVTFLDHFTLDSYRAGGAKFTPAATSRISLQNGLYVAVVQGTFSYYGAINYVVPQPPWTILCGTPEGAPQFSSAGGAGPVGFDAEFVFARPWTTEMCSQAKLPVHWLNFQEKLGPGEWGHPATLTPQSAPSPTHSYEYAVTGRKGKKAAFRLYDIDTRDNYGSLHISLRAATAADCTGTQYLAFGLASEAECLSEIPLALKPKKHH